MNASFKNKRQQVSNSKKKKLTQKSFSIEKLKTLKASDRIHQHSLYNLSLV